MTRDAGLQLPLLEDAPAPPVRSLRERLAALTWSYSRRSTLEQCARRYYYEYYGANRRLAKGVADKEDLHFLKQLATRHERAGSIVHMVIAWYLRQVQKGAVPGVERLVGWARQLYAADRAYSRAHPDGAVLAAPARFPPVLLREYHYRDPRADLLCDETETRLAEALVAFATAEAFSEFRRAAGVPGALIEAPVRLGAGVPCRVDGKVDLAFRGDPAVTVVDWKLGEGDGSGDDSLQLAVYALWAVEHFACAADELRLYKAYLGSREAVEFRVEAAVLAATRARVTQDAERMLALHEYGAAGTVEAFSPCLQPAVCKACPFLRACPEGSQLAHA
jgi:hypothetical protein